MKVVKPGQEAAEDGKSDNNPNHGSNRCGQLEGLGRHAPGSREPQDKAMPERSHHSHRQSQHA